MTEQRRLAAIVSADVAGYSRLMGRDESGTLAALKALRREIVDPRISAHNGRIVKTTGDGLLLEFASVVDAVRCVIEVQTAMAEKTADVPADQRIAFRVGVNIGDIIIDSDDIFGDGVNVAARLQEIAPSGGICISSRVHDDVRDRLDTAFDDGGTQTLKNIARPVQVWRWSPIGGTAVVTAAPIALPDKPSIAVLPFQNMSDEAEQEHFADGMTEDILTGLARFQNLFVIARNSSFTYKGQAVDVKKAGAELGVRYLLEGSVRASGQRVRITAQLIEAATAHHVWAERYDRALTDIFDIQDEVTAQIVAAIDFEVRGAEALRSRGLTAAGLEAWAQYHKAFPLLFRLTREENQRASALFDVLRTDYPTFATGHAGYGFSLTSEAIYGWTRDRRATARAAIPPCRQAVELDDKDAFCHLALGRALLVAGERDLALASIERAVARNPNAALAHMFRGMALIGLERYAEAIISVDLAIRLSPRDPGIWSFYLWRATCHAALGNVDASVEAARQSVRERPDLWLTYANLATFLARTPRLDEAKAAMAKARDLHPGLSLEEFLEVNALFVSAALLHDVETLVTSLGLRRRPVGPAALPLPDKPSIAVLPFQNMSGDPEQEYFTDGMVEDVITGLSRFKSLFVIARNSSFTYKGKAVDIRQVGRELGVRYVLEGSVRKAANRLRITGQLIDASTGAHLWADHFDGVLEDVFDLQDRVTSSVVGAIAPKLEQAEIERAMRKPTGNLDAYDCFLRAKAHYYVFSKESLLEARRLFRHATDLDPTYAAAYGLGASCIVLCQSNSWLADPARDIAEGVALARRAVAVGMDDPDALVFSCAGFAYLAGDVESGIALADRAILLNPNFAVAWRVSGWLCVYKGEHADAIVRLDRAMRLSPFDLLSHVVYTGLSLAHLFACRYDEAASWARKAALEKPDWTMPLRAEAIACALSGRMVEAQKAIARMRAVDPTLRVSNLEKVMDPFRRAEDRALYIEGLRRAGLPE